ncbi:MAG TPA: PKD domain-containing protein [Solirubrobacteraceae bacterium]|nr:PKD domain-containing protein [Solirubrobacteraceae bacterium]
MGRLWLLGAVLAAALLAPSSALAANALITLGPGNTLNPSGSATIGVGETVSWRWTEDKGHHIASLPSSSEFWDSTERKLGPDFTHTFPNAGSFSYVCQVHPDDMNGTITVSGSPPPPGNGAPSAAISASTTTPASGESVTFDAGGSSDSDGTIANYAWDLDANGTFETSTGTTTAVSRAYSGPASPTVAVRVTDNGGLSDSASVGLAVAAPPAPPNPPPSQQDPPPAQPPAPANPEAPALITQAATVPAALSATSAAPKAPTFSASTGQKLKRQKGVKISASCPGGCQLVLTGTVKVGLKTLKLTKLTKTIATGASAVLTVKVTDAKALRRARGKAKATIKAASTSGGQSATKTITVNLTA